MRLDRSEKMARALAKAQAYAACNKMAEAEQWARRLVALLGLAGILNDDDSEMDEREHDDSPSLEAHPAAEHMRGYTS
jgi:hypothetical protein